MPSSARDLLKQAIRLPVADRAVMADELFESLHAPDAAFEASWLREAQDRLAAFRHGEIEAVDADEVLADRGQRD